MSVMTKQDKINILQGWVQHSHLTHLKNLELACKDDHIDAYEDVLFPMGWNTCDRCGALGDSELDFCWVDGFDWQDDNEDDQAILRAIGEEENRDNYCAICWECINELKKKGKSNGNAI